MWERANKGHDKKVINNFVNNMLKNVKKVIKVGYMGGFYGSLQQILLCKHSNWILLLVTKYVTGFYKIRPVRLA